MLTLTAGIIVAILASVLTVSVDYAISQVPLGSTYQSNAMFEAAVWSGITDPFLALGYALIGVGLVLLGWLAWSNDRMPGWVAIIAAIGGVGGLVTPFALLVFAFPTIISIGAVILVSFAMGIQLLRRGSPSSGRTDG
jgi:hypothetical protein